MLARAFPRLGSGCALLLRRGRPHHSRALLRRGLTGARAGSQHPTRSTLRPARRASAQVSGTPAVASAAVAAAAVAGALLATGCAAAAASDGDEEPDGTTATGAESSSSPPPPSAAAEAAAVREITQTELGRHCTAASCWIAIDGAVYDVTEWLKAHPGGGGAILAAAGTDASAQFAAFHHADSELPRRVAATLKIGRLVASAPAQVAERAASTGSAAPPPAPEADAASPAAGGTVMPAPSPPHRRHVTVRCTPAELRSLQSVPQMAAEALRRAAPALMTSIDYGAEDDESLRNNRAGFARYRLRPRVLRDVSRLHTRVSILGGRITLAFPVAVGPFAGASGFHPDGELALARAAAKAGVAFVVPQYGGYPLEELAEATTATTAAEGTADGVDDDGTCGEGGLMLQLYLPRSTAPDGSDAGPDRAFLQRVIRHAAKNGVQALVLTVDTVTNGNRERTFRDPAWAKGMAEQVGGMPRVRTLEGALEPGGKLGWPAGGHTQAMTWTDVAWVKAQCQLPAVGGGMAVVVKGVMTAEDTALAVAAGADAVVVSNHGGRQLDGTDGTIEAVAECVAAADGRLDVFVDGGFRRGKDVFKALALGAKAVFLGRAAIYGLLLGGEAGVDRSLDILRAELATVMKLAGEADARRISPSSVRDREQQWR